MNSMQRLEVYLSGAIAKTTAKEFLKVRDALLDTLPEFISLLKELMISPSSSAADRKWAGDQYSKLLTRMFADSQRDRDRGLHRDKVKFAARRTAMADKKIAAVAVDINKDIAKRLGLEEQ